jgi:formylglycine-generating enzyme required for sulfatase activity
MSLERVGDSDEQRGTQDRAASNSSSASTKLGTRFTTERGKGMNRSFVIGLMIIATSCVGAPEPWKPDIATDITSDSPARNTDVKGEISAGDSKDLDSLMADDKDGEAGIVDGETTDTCTPNCDGKDCGDDGCGGSCGGCTKCGEKCLQGECLYAPCIGRECGPDGCGGLCGECDQGACNVNYGLCADSGWVLIPEGNFPMGAPETEPCSEDDERPQHEVSVTRPMLVSNHEVTQGEWQALASGNPSYHGPNGQAKSCVSEDCPVETVSWFEAVTFANMLSEQRALDSCYSLSECSGVFGVGCLGPSDNNPCDGFNCAGTTFVGLECNGYRLPTEAEWEYLARAGTTKALAYPPPVGSSIDDECDICGPDPTLEAYAWYCHNKGQSGTHPVASLGANAWGLYDMAGNVSEWVWDEYQDDFYSDKSEIDPLGGSHTYRVLRGSNRTSPAGFSRSASRHANPPDKRSYAAGFRLVRSVLTECVPDCTDNGCGDDGCGGKCGECGEGEVCQWEQCETVLPSEYVLVPAGTFVMGTPDGSGDLPAEKCRSAQEVQHEVQLARPFYVKTTEVTQAEWKAAMGDDNDTSKFQACGGDCAANSMSWYEAIDYCNKLSEMAGLEPCYELEGNEVLWPLGQNCEGYRLPTEAEWEYATRGGTTTASYGGNIEDCYCDVYPTLDEIGWYCGNLPTVTYEGCVDTSKNTYPGPECTGQQPVATKTPNPWGLYDVAGGIWEWCWDWHGPYPGDVVDPTGPDLGEAKILRGGSWGDSANYTRSGARLGAYVPDAKHYLFGFRPVRTACELECEDKECGAGFCGGECGECPESLTCNPEGMCQSPYEPTWVSIQGGSFEMGCSPDDGGCEQDEKPPHTVVVSAFDILEAEVTQAQYLAVVGQSPSWFKGCPECPVESVDWLAASSFCAAINGRLPSEAEWEYAARGGDPGAVPCNGASGCLGDTAWYSDNSEGLTHVVMTKSPNSFGLYDMSGNVWEWVDDWYAGDYYCHGPESTCLLYCKDCVGEVPYLESWPDPPGPIAGTVHGLRGASWKTPQTKDPRVSDRGYSAIVTNEWGFRCARDCIPSCGNNECGDDGCGGSCGGCGPGEYCPEFSCVKNLVLPDTGQVECYDDAVAIPCPGPGEAFFGQDASYLGTPVNLEDNEDGTVTETVTGLTWQKCLAGQSLEDCSGEGLALSWEDAKDHCTGNSDDLPGTGWRLPSLVERLTTNFAFPSCIGSVFYDGGTGVKWDWTAQEFDSDHAYNFSLTHCGTGGPDKTLQGNVRCVRGPEFIPGVFEDNLDGTVADLSTELVWQQVNDEVERTWGEALAYCQQLELGDQSDWRLPNAKEVYTLADFKGVTWSVNEDYFPPASGRYWTSTSFSGGDHAYGIQVNAALGAFGSDEKQQTWFVRCVR